MLFWTIQIILISFILIFLVHHLIQFFTNTLTVPKIKDLVHSPSKKYETIYEILSKNREKNDSTTSIIDLLPSIEKQEIQEIQKPKDSMKDELKNFLKSQLNPDSSNVGSTPLDSISFYQFK
jgi:hypothetical protein